MQAHLSLESLEARRMLSRGVPLAPTDLIETHSSESAITLGWTDNASNETGFRIERWNGRRWKAIGKVGANTTAFTNTPLNAGAVYAYRVFSFNKAGSSHSAAFVGDATTLLVANDRQPTDLAATIVSATHTIVQFTDNATSEAGFNIQVSADGGPWTLAGTVNGTPGKGPRLFDFSGAQPAQTYAFRVAAFSATRVFDYSAPVVSSVAVPGARPAVLPSGKYYTLVEENISSVLTEYALNVQRMNADGSVDTTFKPQRLEAGYPVEAKILTGMPNGNIVVEGQRRLIMGNHGGDGFTDLTILGENGIVATTQIARDPSNSLVFLDPIQISVGIDNKLIVATTVEGDPGLSSNLFTTIKQYNSDLTTASGFGGYSFLPDTLTELPDGLGVATFGNYLKLVSSEGIDPLGLSKPTAIGVTSAPVGVHLSIADSGSNETRVLVTLAPPLDSVWINYAHQIIVGTITSAGKPTQLTLDDVTGALNYQYLAYPVHGWFIGEPMSAR
jgi:hypothetical protein